MNDRIIGHCSEASFSISEQHLCRNRLFIVAIPFMGDRFCVAILTFVHFTQYESVVTNCPNKNIFPEF